MNSKAINFIRSFSYTLTSNFFSLIVSTLVILIVPKLIGVEDYGYWQLYLFYSSYVGFLHFGWNDGIYLRYGGREYKSLEKNIFFSQFYMLFILQIIIAGIIVVFSSVFISDADRMFIFQMIAVCMLAVNLRFMLLYILQGTNRIKEYAQITMLDRILYCLIIILILVAGIRDFKLMVVADVIAKLVSLVFAMYYCKDIVFHKFSQFNFTLRETIKNINVGIKLMFATIASMLIIGVVRFGIEHSWEVSTFGKISLTLSISNLLMLFINAVGIIMFPILRRTEERKLPIIYTTMRTFLMVILLGILLVYYPFKVLLSSWLPQYTDSLMYMAIIFPMCVYEGKMSLLINTYLKTLREEKMILKINIITLALSIITTFFTTIILESLNLAILSIIVLLVFKCVLSELYLLNMLGITLYKDIILELIMTFVFIFTGWYLNSWSTVLLYAIAFITYLFIKRKDIVETFKYIKYLIKY